MADHVQCVFCGQTVVGGKTGIAFMPRTGQTRIVCAPCAKMMHVPCAKLVEAQQSLDLKTVSLKNAVTTMQKRASAKAKRDYAKEKRAIAQTQELAQKKFTVAIQFKCPPRAQQVA